MQFTGKCFCKILVNILVSLPSSFACKPKLGGIQDKTQFLCSLWTECNFCVLHEQNAISVFSLLFSSDTGCVRFYLATEDGSFSTLEPRSARLQHSLYLSFWAFLQLFWRMLPLDPNPGSAPGIHHVTSNCPVNPVAPSWDTLLDCTACVVKPSLPPHHVIEPLSAYPMGNRSCSAREVVPVTHGPPRGPILCRDWDLTAGIESLTCGLPESYWRVS